MATIPGCGRSGGDVNLGFNGAFYAGAVKRFFGTPMTLWPLRNRLHVYVLPDDDLRSELGKRQRILKEFDYCSIQPAEYLHATVQQFAVSTEDTTAEQTAAFMDALKLLAATTAPFSIQLAAPKAEDWALGARGTTTPEWKALVEGVRTAAARTINSGTPMPEAPNRPHISLGYGLADGSSEDIQRASDDVTTNGLPPLKIKEMHFLAVHQNIERGTYTWNATSPVTLAGPPTRITDEPSPAQR
ncbi:hypothetical protein AHiyo6_06890 [Arthrobacter sp. Hiyo6]|nr:hypothetical protein AHiyo6_06890 [Arthrobacter sp. Hiyo6]